jgi:hypothetical protein
MKIIPSSRGHHHVARVSIFLITVALILGMVGCESTPTPQYDLSITSTAGGSVTTPGETTFTYKEGTKVNLVATPDDCYHFTNWTGDVGAISDVNDATTTIIMNGNYSITANFEGEEVTFADHNLEAAVREAIAIPVVPIYASDLDGLISLNASARNITDLTGLECATSLTRLWLLYNQISDISPLANLTGLTWLDIQYNQISDISPLANLTNLTDLRLTNNQINDISPLANLTGLTKLDIQYNQISDISPLANLTNLTWLGLTNNQISDISPLTNLTNLTGLYFSLNPISDISPLANLTSLTDLHLLVNQISDISPLANLTNLLYLDLSLNQISDISPLTNLTNLTELGLNDNQISDISPLVQNQGLGTGDEVSLLGNPLSSDSINTHIPTLQARGVTVDY